MNIHSVKAAIAKLSVAGLVVLAILIATPAISKAENGTKDKKSKAVPVAKSQVSVKYAGMQDNNVVFRVQFHNPTGQKFNLIIRNHNGDEIYRGRYSDVHFSKTIYLVNDDEEMAPTFTISTLDQDIDNSFTINTNVEDAKEAVVTKL
ncbi:hypothetical protein [Filimonas effusa]|uniref:Uncharacterized protein n=1 Tax=Filimonas effusa TaxID=2508721 RepID=A0A4Q1D283_9BACT|nr:hypothetical protein [Filimonas effusa]RXK81317.1 hypothetical protein ESB13_20490 [Filimonas effusa]